MIEPGARVLCRNQRQAFTNGLVERVFGARSNSAQIRFELAPDLLHGIPIRRIRRQKPQLTPTSLDQLAHGAALVKAQVVHDHDLTRHQPGTQYLLAKGLKSRSISSTFKGHHDLHTLPAHSAAQSGVLAPVLGHAVDTTFLARRPAIKQRQTGLRTAFIHTDKASRVYLSDLIFPLQPLNPEYSGRHQSIFILTLEQISE